MQKIYTLITALSISVAVNAQTQRLVLFEEFTGETCPPCAQINPGLNQMLNNESAKIVSIKYQNNIPSAGPRFWPYAQTDITARQNYYSNNYSPQGIMDGTRHCLIRIVSPRKKTDGTIDLEDGGDLPCKGIRPRFQHTQWRGIG